MRTRIKICGITRPEDAALAAAVGVDAVGLVFYPAAKRCISIDTAKEILRALPPYVTPVGLFVDQTTDTIRSTAETLNLRHLQLHGHEPAAQISELAAYTIVKAVRVDPTGFADSLAKWTADIRAHSLRHVRAIILETAASFPGGTGAENDWSAVADAQRAGLFKDLPPAIAAGGLRPDNVGGVVRMLRPFAVDVSSGVEESFGRKSSQKLKDFVAAVRSADDASGL